MFHDVDEVLRQLLIREIPIKNGEVDIAFDQPKREWSARVNRPTINLFLHNLHENVQLRHSQQWIDDRNKDGTVTQKRVPVRLDLHYLITTWANEPEDEHNLLAYTLIALFRHANLPADLLPEGLKNQTLPVRLQIAQEDSTLRSLADIWASLDNEVKPGITMIITLTLDPYLPIITPIVRTVETRIGQSHRPETLQLIKGYAADVFWTVGGYLQTDKPLEQIQITLVERGVEIPIREEGWFSISNLRAGEYTLDVKVNGGKAKQHKITVPAPDYNLQI